MRKRSLKGKALKWLDGFRMTGISVIILARRAKFWAVFLPVFLVFGTLLSMFASGWASFSLFFASDLGGKFAVLAGALGGLFGVGRNFWDFLLTFSIATLQALLITLIALIYKHKRLENKPRRNGEKQKRNKNKQKQDENEQKQNAAATEAVPNAGIAAGLALLGSGCPTCGTTLITPILSTIFSSGTYAVAGTISGIITAVAVIIAILSIRKLGVETYVIILNERRLERQKKEENEQNN